MSDSLWPHGLQHVRLLCPSLSPRNCSNFPNADDVIQPSQSLSPLLIPSTRIFSSELALPIRWPKYWSFSFSIRPSNEYSLLISFKIRWFDPLVVQETLKSLLQHSIWMHQFFGTPLSLWSNSHTGIWLLGKKSIGLTIGTFVSKVMSLIFNMFSGFVRAFLPRSMCLLISSLQSTPAVIGAQENKICHCFSFFPIYLSWSDGTRWHDLSFFECWVLKPASSLSCFTFIKRHFSYSWLPAP